MRTKKEECIIDEMGRVSLPSLFMQLTKTRDKRQNFFAEL